MLHLDPVLIFVMAALGVIPLAGLIGEGTEELAVHTGPKIGGLLNATLGNAAELIITIFAIREGPARSGKSVDYRLDPRQSAAGDGGAEFVVGRVEHGIQKFDRRNASVNATLLIMVLVALMVPSLFDAAMQQDLAAELGLSEGVAVVMILLYALSMVYSFTAKTTDDGITREPAVDHEPHHAKWSVRTSLIVLGVATLGIVFLSEILVGAVEHVTVELGLTEFFIGIIIIPLVGNIAEHLVAVQVAMKN